MIAVVIVLTEINRWVVVVGLVGLRDIDASSSKKSEHKLALNRFMCEKLVQGDAQFFAENGFDPLQVFFHERKLIFDVSNTL